MDLVSEAHAFLQSVRLSGGTSFRMVLVEEVRWPAH